MLWITISVLAVVEVLGFLFARKYETNEKVDKGIELCYWKLSYRRKFIRILWLLPVDAIIMLWFYKNWGIDSRTVLIGFVILGSVFVQAFYNYKKWEIKSCIKKGN